MTSSKFDYDEAYDAMMAKSGRYRLYWHHGYGHVASCYEKIEEAASVRSKRDAFAAAAKWKAANAAPAAPPEKTRRRRAGDNW